MTEENIGENGGKYRARVNMDERIMNSPHTLSSLDIQMRSGWLLLAYLIIFIVAACVTVLADSQLLQKAGACVWIFCIGFFCALTLPIWSRNAAEEPESHAIDGLRIKN